MLAPIRRLRWLSYHRVDSPDAIRYWDASLRGWAPITNATCGDDCALQYVTEGDVTGYMALTVFTPIPEPSAVVMLAIGAMLFAAPRRCRN